MSEDLWHLLNSALLLILNLIVMLNGKMTRDLILGGRRESSSSKKRPVDPEYRDWLK